MKKTDLAKIADLLEGYSYDQENSWEIEKAEKNGPNSWFLIITKRKPAEEPAPQEETEDQDEKPEGETC